MKCTGSAIFKYVDRLDKPAHFVTRKK